jgi:hypothetical protein
MDTLHDLLSTLETGSYELRKRTSLSRYLLRGIPRIYPVLRLGILGDVNGQPWRSALLTRQYS